GGPFGSIGADIGIGADIEADIEIVHNCLNGTYYLATYDRCRRHGLPACGMPAAQGPRCASDDFKTSHERGARAPMSEKNVVYCWPQLRRDPRSKLRRGGGS